MGTIDSDYLLQRLIAMLEIPSPSLHGGAMVRWLQPLLAEFGLEVP